MEYTFTIETDFLGGMVPVDIEYSVTGKHIPETRMQPAEEPELEITAVNIYGCNILSGLNDEHFEVIMDEANDNYTIEIESAAAAKADFEYEQYRERRAGL